MKNIIRFSSLMLSLLPAVTNAQYADYGPMGSTAPRDPQLYIRLPQIREQQVQVLNAYLSSVDHAMVKNSSINGIGTNADINPLTPESFSEKGLRFLSNFDLKMSAITILGLEPRIDSPIYEEYVGGYTVDAPTHHLGPMPFSFNQQTATNDLVNILKYGMEPNVRAIDNTCTQEFTEKIRDGLKSRLSENFPTGRPTNVVNGTLENVDYIVRSYLPILATGDLFVQSKAHPVGPSKSSHEIHQVFFSTPGALVNKSADGKYLEMSQWRLEPIRVDLAKLGQPIVTSQVIFDNLGLQPELQNPWDSRSNNLNMMMLQTYKDYSPSQVDKLNVKVSFGKLNINKANQGCDLNPNKASDMAPLDLSDPDSGIVLDGRLNLPPAKNFVSKAVNEILSKIHIRLSIASFNMVLNRDPGSKSTNQDDIECHKLISDPGGDKKSDSIPRLESYWKAALRDGCTFRKTAITSDPNQLVEHVTVSWLLDHQFIDNMSKNPLTFGFTPSSQLAMGEFEVNTALMGLVKLLSGSCVPAPAGILKNKNDQLCKIEFDSMTAFNDKMSGFLQKLVSRHVLPTVQGQTADSINQQLPGGITQMDQAIDQGIQLVMDKAAEAYKTAQALKSLQKKISGD